jgi:CRP-like cAMP-binding protein
MKPPYKISITTALGDPLSISDLDFQAMRSCDIDCPALIRDLQVAVHHVEGIVQRHGAALNLRGFGAALGDYLCSLDSEWNESPADLAERFGVSRREVERTYRELVKAGVVHDGRLKESAK